MKKQYSHAVCYTYEYAYTYFGIYTKQNERHIVSIHPREIGDFDFRIKQKTLSYLYRRFLPPDRAKIRFSFTMQRSMRILFLQTYGKYFERGPLDQKISIVPI